LMVVWRSFLKIRRKFKRLRVWLLKAEVRATTVWHKANTNKHTGNRGARIRHNV